MLEENVQSLLVSEIKLNRMIENTEDIEFIINNQIRLYLHIEEEFKITMLNKIKCPFMIFFDKEINIKNKKIPSSFSFEILVSSSFEPSTKQKRIFSIHYDEFC